jgi:hypothetical protein
MAAPDMKELIKNQRDKATPAGVPPVPPTGTELSDASTPPSAAPMSTPEPKMGNREGAMVNISMAMDLLEQSLPALGSESEEGQKVLSAIRTITGVIGAKKAKTGELQQSEILQLLQTLPQAGGATPEGKALSQAPAIPGMSPSAPPPAMGGAPGGMPGGPTPQLT